MPFINSPVDTETLPMAEAVPLQPIHPNYKKILVTECILTTLVLAAVAIALILFIPLLRNSYGWMIIAGISLLISAFYFYSITQSFPVLAYAVRDRDVVYRKGWIIRTIKICPFNRVQNCSVQSGPLERRYGLASLIIYTAGSNGADMRIPGLLQEEADRLRYFILGKIHSEDAEQV